MSARLDGRQAIPFRPLRNVMRMMAEKYAAPSYQGVMVAFELLNEPLMSELAGGEGTTRGYYWNGFQNVAYWNGFLTSSGAAGAVIDHHEYQCFTNGYAAMSAQEHIGAACSNDRSWGGGQEQICHWGRVVRCYDRPR
jgi:glucan 1,3-beta-glucosidase